MDIWADELIKQYSDGRKQLQKKRERLDKEDPLDQQDLTQINSMIAEMSFVLEWLETGRQPGTFKGVDKKSIYQHRSFESMDFIPDITEQLEEGPKQLYMSAEEKIILADIFASLSLRERQCYILHEARGLSMGIIAEEMAVSKAAVQSYVNRARTKVKMRVS